MSINGIIIVNPYGVPGQSVKQAERLVEEFELKGVKASITPNAFLCASISEKGVKTSITADFAVFLDKDKYLSEMLEKSGIRLYNSHNSIRLCDDKGQTYIALSNSGVNLPKTMFAPVCYLSDCKIIDQQVLAVESAFSYPMIVKRSYGSCGTGVFKVNDREELVSIMDRLKTEPHMFQEYLAKEVGKDIRVIVIGGKAVAGMKRINQNDFRSNIAQGGSGEKIDLLDRTYKPVIDTAEKCAKTLGLDYCGVDILTGNAGEPVVCEVNSNAFFEGIESVTGINVAKLYAEHIIKSLNK